MLRRGWFQRVLTCCIYFQARGSTGTIRASLFADACVKQVYEDHILGEKSTCMVIQTKPSVNRVYQKFTELCAGAAVEPWLVDFGALDSARGVQHMARNTRDQMPPFFRWTTKL